MTENFTQIIKEKDDASLKEIFLNKENYDENFAALARQELLDRKIDIAPLIETRQQKEGIRLQQLQEGKSGNPVYLIFCFLLAFLGGLLGIVGGYIYAFSTIKGGDGDKYFVYESQTRTYGKVIFFTGIASLLFAIWWSSR